MFIYRLEWYTKNPFNEVHCRSIEHNRVGHEDLRMKPYFVLRGKLLVDQAHYELLSFITGIAWLQLSLGFGKIIV